VSSPAVLGRLKDFVKPYDFVLAPIVNDVDLDDQAEKPILITRFTKKIRRVARRDVLQRPHRQNVPRHTRQEQKSERRASQVV